MTVSVTLRSVQVLKLLEIRHWRLFKKLETMAT